MDSYKRNRTAPGGESLPATPAMPAKTATTAATAALANASAPAPAATKVAEEVDSG